MSTPLRSVVVVGASLAGVETARALRSEGFDGSITILGEEPHAPYDRPPLSKGFLDGSVASDELALEVPAEGVILRVGTRAERLLPQERTILTSSGEGLRADAVVLATGARAVQLRTPLGASAGVHVLRTLQDAAALRGDLVAGARLVVVGGGFIGAEVAATAVSLGLDVTVVETQPALLRGQLGDRLASVVAVEHEAKGVRIMTGCAVDSVVGDGRVRGVRLRDGREIPADVVLVGVGSRPNVEWLSGSGLPIDDGVLCDDRGRTQLPGVVAVGDCAAWADGAGRHQRRQHWTAALRQAATSARSLLGLPAEATPAADLDYVWSDQYDLRLQILGRPSPDLRCEVVSGDLAASRFTLAFRDESGVIRAVASVTDPRQFGRWRRQIGTSTPVSVS